MKEEEVRSIIDNLTYKNWQFHTINESGILFLQVRLIENCACRVNIGLMEHRCRKWRISPRMTKSEVIQTAFKAVMAAEEHETRENFKYKGAAIFEPHFDVEALVDLYAKKQWDMRINSWSINAISSFSTEKNGAE